eukprot:SAG22_NODE_1354_length_4636_cov_70.001763_2_plen_372_part_00
MCTGGKVQTCNAGCAALIMPLWMSCRAQLGRAAKILHDAAALCSPAAAHRFLAMCPPNAPAEDCIPTCDEATHGYLLLLSIDGTDTILACELSDDLYDWLGTAELGGFVGENVDAFLPSVISGAAGSYILKLMTNANIRTNLTINPRQQVLISGDRALSRPPTWGSGRFTVAETGSLSLSYMTLTGQITINEGANAVAIVDCTLNFKAERAFTGDGVVVFNCYGDDQNEECAAWADSSYCDSANSNHNYMRGSYCASCKSKAVETSVGTSNTCPELDEVANADPIVYPISQAWRRTVATISCDHGRASMNRTCQGDGSWSPSSPTCTKCCTIYCPTGGSCCTCGGSFCRTGCGVCCGNPSECGACRCDAAC